MPKGYAALPRLSNMCAVGVAYTYDGDGLRVEKSSGTLYWRSYTGEVLEETDTSGNLTSTAGRDYIFFAGRRIAWRDSSGYVYYYFADAIGNTRAATDASGNTCFSADYYPYGQENDYVTACPPTYKFTGYEYDSETGNYYAYARYYNPRLGRFMSPDPIGGAIASPQSLNRYAYVVNNPTNFVDPLGLWCLPVVDGVLYCEVDQGGGGGTGPGMGGGGMGSNDNGCPPKFVAGRIGGLFMGPGPCGGRGGGGGGGTGGGKKQKQQVRTDKNGKPCDLKILERVNAQFGTNIPLNPNTVIELGARGGPTWNILVRVPAGVLPQGSISSASRYPGDSLGVGSTLHIVNSFVTVGSSGVVYDNFQAHLDQGDPYLLPFGALSHLDYVLTHTAGPCP